MKDLPALAYPLPEGTQLHRIFLILAAAATAGETPDLELIATKLGMQRISLGSRISQLSKAGVLARVQAVPRGFHLELVETGARTGAIVEHGAPYDPDWLLARVREGIAQGKGTKRIAKDIGCAPDVVRFTARKARLSFAQTVMDALDQRALERSASTGVDAAPFMVEPMGQNRVLDDACWWCAVPVNRGDHSRCGAAARVVIVPKAAKAMGMGA